VTTVYRRGLIDATERNCAANPELAAEVVAVLDRLRRGYYDARWVNALFQKWEGRARPDIYDAYAFAVLWSDLFHGRTLHVRIEVGESPHGDKCVAENQAALDQLPRPFTAQCWSETGRGANCDGMLRWPTSINLQATHSIDQDQQLTRDTIVSYPAGSAPLEIGYTAPERTFCHLQMNRAVARWPYGSEDIWLFVRALDPQPIKKQDEDEKK
jgi:hypothetical protein